MQLNQSSGEWRLVGNVEVESAAMGNNHPTRDTPRSRRTIDDVLNGHDSPRAPPSKPPREPSIRRQPPPPPPRGESALMREAEDADRRDGFSDDEGSAVSPSSRPHRQQAESSAAGSPQLRPRADMPDDFDFGNFEKPGQSPNGAREADVDADAPDAADGASDAKLMAAIEEQAARLKRAARAE